MAPVPITAAMVARSRVAAEPRWSPDGRFLAWAEAYAARVDLVVAPADGSGPPQIVSADTPVSSVGAYGGGAFTWADGATLVYAAADGRLLAVPAAGGPPRVLSRDGRAAAPAVSPDGARAAFVLERDDRCDIAVVPLDASSWPVRVSGGADYAFDPAWSPDGRTVVWHEWDFPDMPWDASRIAARDLDGMVPAGPVRTIAGGDGVSTGQPRFGPGGALAYTCDRTGWNVVWVARADGSGARPVLDEPREHAQPTWGPGQRSFAFAPDGSAVALCRNVDGFGQLVVVPMGRGRARVLDDAWHVGLDWGGGGIVSLRSGPDHPPEVAVLGPGDGARRVLARPCVAGLAPPDLPAPQAVTWRGDDGATVHGLLWRPAGSSPGPGSRPPLLVLVHGGPTSQATAAWNGRAAFFRARGWAVLMPNARGSTGYGRPYAQALAGRWGELDVADTAAGIRHAVREGWCDPERVAIAGGSAGGLTVLLVCAHHGDLVRAGVDLYGVTDLFDLAETTHRYESRYLDRIVGELPRDAHRYRDRSPITHAQAIRVPLLVLHGTDDPAVPRAQADALVESVRRAGGIVEYQVYEGEGHGWSRPETVQDELERTERFLTRWVLRR